MLESKNTQLTYCLAFFYIYISVKNKASERETIGKVKRCRELRLKGLAERISIRKNVRKME